jgi:hypothetical protein
MAFFGSVLDVLRGFIRKSPQEQVTGSISIPIEWTGVHNMEIIVNRKRKTQDGIFGELSLDTNAFTCFTVEHLQDAIPAGIWDVTFDFSPHFNQTMPHIWVPERDQAAVARGDANAGLRIHPANWPQQLLGCIAVGDKEEPDSVDNSRVTFNQLYKIIQGQTALKIKVNEAYEPTTVDQPSLT